MKRIIQWTVAAIAVMVMIPSAFGQFLIRVTPSTLDYGALHVGASQTLQAYLEYEGTQAAQLVHHWSPNSVQGDADQFAVTVSVKDSSNLRHGDTVMITVVYHPTEIGSHEAQYGFYLGGVAQMLTLKGSAGAIPDLTIHQSACNDIEVGHVGNCTMSFTNTSATMDMRLEFSGVDAPFAFTTDGGITFVNLLMLAAGTTQDVAFTFTPTEVGLVKDEFTIVNGNDTTFAYIEGTGVVTGIPSPITASPSHLAFSVEYPSEITTQVVTVGNTSSAAFTLTNITITGAHANAFYVYPVPTLPLVLAAGSSVDIEVTFTPDTTIVEYRAQMDIEGTFNGFAGGSAHVPLTGSVGSSKPDTIRCGMMNTGGQVGETARIVFTNQSYINSNVHYGYATLRYNASVLVPQETLITDAIEDGMRTSTFRIDPMSRVPGTTLAELKFTITLGDASHTPVDLVRMEWYDEQDSRLATQTVANGAVVSVEDAEGRTVNANGDVMTLAATPMPATDVVTIAFAKSPGTARLSMFGTTGVLVKDLTSALQGAPDKGSVQVDVSDLPVGTYYLRLSVGTTTVVRRIIVN